MNSDHIMTLIFSLSFQQVVGQTGFFPTEDAGFRVELLRHSW